MTFTVTVQLDCAPKLAPVSCKLGLAPVFRVTEPLAQVVEAFGEAAKTSPDGSALVNDTLLALAID